MPSAVRVKTEPNTAWPFCKVVRCPTASAGFESIMSATRDPGAYRRSTRARPPGRLRCIRRRLATSRGRQCQQRRPQHLSRKRTASPHFIGTSAFRMSAFHKAGLPWPKLATPGVSSVDQDFNGQIERLRAAGCDQVFSEKASGKSTNGRHALDKAIKTLRPGDTLVTVRLDRLARSIRDLLNLVDTIEKAARISKRSMIPGSTLRRPTAS
jgi:hypothetical protein